MAKPLDDFRRLAGFKNLHEHQSWRLVEEPAFAVGAQVQATEDAGTESGKEGRVLTLDDGWAQVVTKSRELFWLPHYLLAPTDSIE